MTDDNWGIIDGARTAELFDVGAPEYAAATVVGAEGGELPIEVVRRITIASRTHRCGRRTKSGQPCRVPVQHAGDTCSWHRASTDTPKGIPS
jgi:hypothetical protein